MIEVEVLESNNRQHRLTVRKDGVTIKLAQGSDEKLKNKVVRFFTQVAKKHKDTQFTLRGSTDKVELGISLFNDRRTKCFHHEGSFRV